WNVHGLPRADRQRSAGDRHRARGLALSAHDARLEGTRRVELDDRAGRAGQRRQRCPRSTRRPRHRASHHPEPALAAHPRGEATVKPAKFDYFAPASVDEALALLTRYGGEAKILAGGQSLVPLLNFRLSRPAALIDINRIPALAYIRPHNGEVR